MIRFIIPNCVLIVPQAIVNTLIGENASQHLRGTCQQKLRPAISGSVRVPAHAWSMEPSFQEPRESSVRRQARQFDGPLSPIYDVAGMTLFVSVRTCELYHLLMLSP
jgi:hypothetical protein